MDFSLFQVLHPLPRETLQSVSSLWMRALTGIVKALVHTPVQVAAASTRQKHVLVSRANMGNMAGTRPLQVPPDLSEMFSLVIRDSSCEPLHTRSRIHPCLARQGHPFKLSLPVERCMSLRHISQVHLTITGLSGLFTVDGSQHTADWHPKMCSPGCNHGRYLTSSVSRASRAVQVNIRGNTVALRSVESQTC